MKLTGKALKDFNNWLPKHYQVIADGLDGNFHSFDDSLKWGVYVDFFDSKDLRIFVSDNIQSHAFKGSYSERLKLSRYGYEVQHDNNGSFYHKTIQEARKAAIEKANEIYNTSL